MAVDILQNAWPEWKIEKQLGKGSYGVVYKAVRQDHHVESRAAIKVISIPSDSSEIDSLRSEGLGLDATRTYLQEVVNDFVSEIQLMESLKGIQNIVSVEDYKVVEKTDTLGWDIFIRMELLTPFNTYICDKTLDEEEVIKLGCDICTALDICSKRNIIHRDIKPENIFVNDFGYFKLGDFGIARKLENMTGGLSQKGTPYYMAPEVANSNNYDARVDTYSLGIVLYRLLNKNRLPFLDTEKQLLNPNERRRSVDRRLQGEALPAPCDASPAMANLIFRACAFNPDQRFASAAEMKQALLNVSNGTYQVRTLDFDKTTSVRRAPSDYNQTIAVRKAPAGEGKSVDTFGDKSKNSHWLGVIAVLLVVAILIVGGIIYSMRFANGKAIETAETDKTTEGDTAEAADDDKHITDIIAEAEELAAAKDYGGAQAKVQDGLDIYPDSEALQEKADEYSMLSDEQSHISAPAEADSHNVDDYHEQPPAPNAKSASNANVSNTSAWGYTEVSQVDPLLFLGSAQPGTTDLVMTIADVNIRTGPGTDYDKIKMVDPGTVYACYGMDSGWFIIDYDGKTRYVTSEFARYVQQKDLSSGVIGTLVTTTGVNVRKGPDTNYDIVDTLEKGRKLVYIGKTGGWYRVVYYDGSVAYISGDYVRVS